MRRIKKSSLRKLREQLEASQKELVIKLYGRDCYTCPSKNLQGKNCHLGHVPWPRTDLSTECKFDPAFTRIQCMVCNIHKGGRGAFAYQRMLAEGADLKAMWERNLATKGKTYNRAWLEERLATYRLSLDKTAEIAPSMLSTC